MTIMTYWQTYSPIPPEALMERSQTEVILNSMKTPCYGLYLNVPTQSHTLIGAALDI